MQKEAFGKLLVILRKKNGLSQKELAERLSVSTSAVSKWENGKNLPDMMMLSRIADILRYRVTNYIIRKRHWRSWTILNFKKGMWRREIRRIRITQGKMRNQNLNPKRKTMDEL